MTEKESFDTTLYYKSIEDGNFISAAGECEPIDPTYAIYGTSRSIGIDLILQEDLRLYPHNPPTKIEFPVPFQEFIKGRGYLSYDLGGMLVPRSSVGRRGLKLANTIGIIDPDYTGNLIAYVLLDSWVQDAQIFNKGDRLLQLVLIPANRSNSVTTKNSEARGAGGFGSTGE